MAERRTFVADEPLLVGDDPSVIDNDTRIVEYKTMLIAQGRTKVVDKRALLDHEHASLDQERVLVVDRITPLGDDYFMVSDRAWPCGGRRSPVTDGTPMGRRLAAVCRRQDVRKK